MPSDKSKYLLYIDNGRQFLSRPQPDPVKEEEGE